MKQKKLLMLIAMVLVVVLCASVLTACKKDQKPGSSNKPSGPNIPSDEEGVNQTIFDYVDPATCTHVDEDHNCVCDKCFTGMKHNIVNGVCTVCNNPARKEGNFTYQDAVSTLPTMWNQHTYQTKDDSYPIDFITNGLYEFHFNGSKSGYEIWPVMASAYPEDITKEIKTVEKWGIPADAKRGYAYKIRLNKNAKWDDGTPINADTYVESYKLLMDPKYNNYRVADYLNGQVVFKNSDLYNYQNKTIAFPAVDMIGENIEDWANKNLYFDAEKVKAFGDIFGTPDMANLAVYKEMFVSNGVNIYDELAKYSGENRTPLTQELFDKIKGLFAADGGLGAYWGWADEEIGYFTVTLKTFSEFSFEDVGIYKTGEYEFNIVLSKACSGFYLLYNLSGNWIVKPDKYKACITVDEITHEYKNTYNTSIDTTCGYGPYKIKEFQKGKYIEFVRNENWFGYSDSRFDCMYQTSRITCEEVTESATRKQMFLKGQVETYGLQAEDYEQYGTSDYLYSSPGTTIFFMILYGNETELKKAEKPGVNKTIIANDSFREALSVAFDKAEFSRTIDPARSPAYSVIGAYDIWNPATGEKYRDTEIAKKAIADYYGVLSGEDEDGVYYYFPGQEDTKYDLDEVVTKITGYNPTLAKQLFLDAYDEWEKAGKIKGTDIIEIEYAASKSSAFVTKILNYLNECIEKIVSGTKLSGRIKFTESAPAGEDWSKNLKSGVSQTCLAGWEGGMLDPFGSLLYYFANDHDPYAKAWWDTSKVTKTMTLPVGKDGANVEITMTLEDWSQCLNGNAKTYKGVTYNFGYEQVADDVRLTIMAELEKVILATNYYIPFMQDGSTFMLSQKLEYALPASDYNAVLGRGGLTYIRYNYTDEAWNEYVTSQGGTLKY